MSDAKGKDKGKGKDDGKDGEAEAKPSKLPMLLALVNLLATGAVGFLVFSAPAAGGPTSEPIDPEVPPIAISLEPFIVNLNEPTSSRYLKTTLEVEVHGEKRQLAFEAKKLAIRSDLLRYLSGLKLDQTLGEDAKMKIHDDLSARLVEILGEDVVAELYLTDFVVQ